MTSFEMLALNFAKELQKDYRLLYQWFEMHRPIDISSEVDENKSSGPISVDRLQQIVDVLKIQQQMIDAEK